MYLLVYFQVSRLSEGLLALVAFVRLLASVLPEVHGKHTPSGEAVGAAFEGTSEVLLLLVNALNVILQVPVGSKQLLTF